MPSLQDMLSSANEEVPKVTAENARELISGRDACCWMSGTLRN